MGWDGSGKKAVPTPAEAFQQTTAGAGIHDSPDQS